MKISTAIFCIISIFMLVGCETVHDGTKKVGTYIGKGADTFGGLTEGAAEGVKGETTSADNPYER